MKTLCYKYVAKLLVEETFLLDSEIFFLSIFIKNNENLTKISKIYYTSVPLRIVFFKKIMI
jgi:hypothetical protein